MLGNRDGTTNAITPQGGLCKNVLALAALAAPASPAPATIAVKTGAAVVQP